MRILSSVLFGDLHSLLSLHSSCIFFHALTTVALTVFNTYLFLYGTRLPQLSVFNFFSTPFVKLLQLQQIRCKQAGGLDQRMGDTQTAEQFIPAKKRMCFCHAAR